MDWRRTRRCLYRMCFLCILADSCMCRRLYHLHIDHHFYRVLECSRQYCLGMLDRGIQVDIGMKKHLTEIDKKLSVINGFSCIKINKCINITIIITTINQYLCRSIPYRNMFHHLSMDLFDIHQFLYHIEHPHSQVNKSTHIDQSGHDTWHYSSMAIHHIH